MIRYINYGTGENTLSVEWFQLVDYIRHHYPSIPQALTTNGYLSEAIKDISMRDIFVRAIDEVDVSLDFSDKSLHNAFRGQENAYDWALKTLELCAQNNKSTTIVFLGSKKNLFRENIDGLFSIAEKYGALLRMNVYRPTEGIDEVSRKFIADYDSIVDMLRYIAGEYSVIALNDTLFSTLLTNETVKDPTGIDSLRILADGSITPNTYLIKSNYTVADIREYKVLKKIENKNSVDGIIQRKVPSECYGCVYSGTCSGGVYDRRFLWYGNLDHKDPYCPGKLLNEVEPCITITQKDFHSVHDGYLPTIFFHPSKNLDSKSN